MFDIWSLLPQVPPISDATEITAMKLTNWDNTNEDCKRNKVLVSHEQ
jgi:hypothetical protein